jgi:class 3 adenylate cyclase
MDIAAWLRGLSLARYAEAFRDNAIDGEVLRRLTAEDLRELGVASIGHRRRLLDAIAALGLVAPAEPTLVPAATVEAERRQLTVMFCDLVGSTALSVRFDPEELREEIRAYQNAVSGVVARYDGFVAKYMGDGVLVYFGYPRAHEDDAERAVRAGLEIAAAVRGLETRGAEPLAIRIGIATGLVVVGDLVGEGSAQEQAVVGETPNLAARLQALAEPGQIVVAGATRRLIGDLFRLTDLGRQTAKGFTEPVEAFAVEGVASAESRFEAARRGLTDLVGRTAESVLLRDRLHQAWAGAGQIVLFSGEAGIGKSRLAAQLAAEVANDPHTRLRYQCSPYHRDSVLHPFVVQLRRAAHLAAEDPAETQLDKLEAHIGAGAHHGNGTALGFPAVDPDARPLSAAGTECRAATPPDPGSLARPARGIGATEAGTDAIRGRPLGRCDLARSARSSADPTIPRTHRIANPARGVKPLDRIGVRSWSPCQAPEPDGKAPFASCLERLSASEVGFGSTAEILRLLERVSFTPASRPIHQLDRSSLLCQ